ncbi:M50 family metallopeptidase [Actinomadura kijaniata]|uniref:M50 family metallopeptidase n=1 Tax=Actinomadura kijaniata TaxID=46161 RepID=UPI003F1C1938
MAFLLGALAFVLALLVSVMLHEAGHLLTAKRFGMKASQFFVGFGPTLWSRRRGETEYGVKAIPLGGFVRIVGYTPLEEVAPADRDRAFHRQPAGRRAIVIAGGVAVNFLVAFLLLVAVAMTLGLKVEGTPTSTVRTVSECVPAGPGVGCGPDDPRSPAAAAGLRAGDRVVSFGGVPVHDWDGLRRAIEGTAPGRAVPVVVERGGTRVTLQARTAASGDGRTFFGMSPRVVGERYERAGPVGAAAFAARTVGAMLGGVATALRDLPAALPRLFSPDRGSTPGGQVGSVVGATDVAGQIFSSDRPLRDKLSGYLALVVMVNVFLGALNVVPLPPLDGGHLAVLVYERARARIARARGRPDPGNVDMTRLMPVTYAATLLLVGLGLLLILADVVNPLRIPR